nr:MAG TPA: hypothetical protein [Caudoviricetes sp.]
MPQARHGFRGLNPWYVASVRIETRLYARKINKLGLVYKC